MAEVSNKTETASSWFGWMSNLQLDGRPMSGDIGAGATRAVVALAARVVLSPDRPQGNGTSIFADIFCVSRCCSLLLCSIYAQPVFVSWSLVSLPVVILSSNKLFDMATLTFIASPRTLNN